MTVAYGWSADRDSPRSRADALFRAAYARLRRPAVFERIEGAEHMVMIDQPGDAFRMPGAEHLLKDIPHRGCIRTDCPCAEVAAQRPEAAPHRCYLFARKEGDTRVDRYQVPVPFDNLPVRGKIQRDNVNLLPVNIGPDIGFGPVREREDPE